MSDDYELKATYDPLALRRLPYGMPIWVCPRCGQTSIAEPLKYGTTSMDMPCWTCEIEWRIGFEYEAWADWKLLSIKCQGLYYVMRTGVRIPTRDDLWQDVQLPT